MKRINMCDMIEYDGKQDLLGHYNEEMLKSILNCLEDQKKLSQINRTIKVGDGRLERYIAFFNKLKQYFPLTGDIVEFGYGEFPIMSFLVDHEQQLRNSGTVTAYNEPSFLLHSKQPPLGKIKFKFETIKPETFLAKCDLMIGIYPCYGTFDMINVASSLNIDFFLVLCDCMPLLGYEYASIYEYAKKRIDKESELIIDTDISKKVEPIIVKRRKHLS